MPTKAQAQSKAGLCQPSAAENAAEMRKAIEINPSNAPALNYLGYSYAESGQHLFDHRTRIGHGFLAAAPAQIRMHHAALDGTRPDNRHLDHQIVKAARQQARQHAHLRPTLDLKNAYRIGPADHVVNSRILGWDVGQGQDSLWRQASNLSILAGKF